MIRKSVFAATSALAALALATPALADPISFDASDVGTSFTINYDGFADGNTIAGLTGSATFTLTGVTGTAYTFDYAVTNTSSGGVGSRISSFSFDTDPDIASATSTGAFDYTQLSSNYPNGIGTVDVCFKGAFSGSCGGNAGGVTTGNTGTGSLTLGFSDPISSLTLDNFFVRYQSITGVDGVTSASGAGTTTTSSGGTPVPEPSMILLFGIGAAAVAFGRRRGTTTAPRLRPAFA